MTAIDAAKNVYSSLSPFGRALFQDVVEERQKTMPKGLAIRETFRELFGLIKDCPPKGVG